MLSFLKFCIIKKQRYCFITDCRAVSQIYAALIALLIILPLFILLFSSYINYNMGLEDQKSITEQRAQESLSIFDVGFNENEVTSIVVNNTGTLELKIRAIYFKSQGTTTFVSDPSVYISPESSKNITLKPTVPFYSNFSLTVSTECGTLSKEFFVPDWAKTEIIYDTENLTIGALRLKFESFECSIYDSKNKEWGEWNPGWNPPMGEYIAWRMNITNVGNNTITLNNRTSLTLSSCDGPTELPWYISNLTQTLPINVTTQVIFLVNSPAQDGNNVNELQKITVGEGVSNMVFLTFFGEMITAENQVRPYGQTIPFEAAIPGG